MKPSESFNVYDVPVGGKMMPPPSYLVNGIETPAGWELQFLVDRSYEYDRNRRDFSAIFRPK